MEIPGSVVELTEAEQAQYMIQMQRQLKEFWKKQQQEVGETGRWK
jgi:hypothetical protein